MEKQKDLYELRLDMVAYEKSLPVTKLGRDYVMEMVMK